MISYIQVPILIVVFVLLQSMWRFWACISRMGFIREIGRRAPFMLQRDILAAVFACLPFVIALALWVGITLPDQPKPLSPLLAAFLSLACLCVCIFILGRNGGRFSGHWAGSRESALRTVAALRLIDAAELNHALTVMQDAETNDTTKYRKARR